MKNIYTDVTMFGNFQDLLNTINRGKKFPCTIHSSRFEELTEKETLALLEYDNLLVVFFGGNITRHKSIKNYLIQFKPEFYEKYKLLF